MSLTLPDLLWPLLGAVLGSMFLALILATLAEPAVRRLKLAQRLGLLMVSVVTLWIVWAGTGLLVRNRNLPLPDHRTEPGASSFSSSPKRSSPSVAISKAATPEPEQAPLAEIFVTPTTVVPLPAPTTPTHQPFSDLQTVPAAQNRRPTADEWVQYQDLRGIRAERRIRLGDARFLKKGGLYYVDFGTIAGLPNQLEVVPADQVKVRLWLGE